MRKLIRDKLGEHIPSNELEFVKSPEEHRDLLIEKLSEELCELDDSDFKDIFEYADVIEVLFALAELNDIDKSEIMAARIEKKYDKGAFKTGLILNRPD